MMKRYEPKQLEPKWQRIWEDTKLYEAHDDDPRPKHYQLEYFPYPSGVTMHVGHVRNYVISDAFVRYQRMRGRNVLHPMGWDAFGLPAENQAIKTGKPPRESTEENIAIFKRQLSQVGLSYDWSREINSSEPDYYRWTQWLFLLMHKRGLAYKAEAAVNWCPVDKTVLANEQVIKKDGQNVCERCGSLVEKRQLLQWFLKITEYADRLLDDLDNLDWPQNIKAMQRNWIGRSHGIDIDYEVYGLKPGIKITTFTTRPDTNFGATFVVLAPEHPFAQQVANGEITPADGKPHTKEVADYVAKSLQKTVLQRQEEGKGKTGTFTGFYVINRLNGEKLPVWVSDFVLAGFGTGAVVGVPGHDKRDFEFAQTFKLPIKRVVVGADGDISEITKISQVQESTGVMMNSGFVDGIPIMEAIEKIKTHIEGKGYGRRLTNYKMHDWLIGRQRYWGTPIPMVHCPKCGAVPVPEDQLPIELPELKDYHPSDDGRSPLARATEWVKTSCPKCDGTAERETDTMDTFLDSSWYFLRFADAHNAHEPFDKQKVGYWLPVDTYVGGAEHAVAHLLYARFWTKVMQDAGLLDFSEPFKTLRNQGMIGGSDGRKMGKRYGNVVTPDDIINQGYGADSLRLYEMFIGPYDQGIPWNPTGIDGTKRFLNRVWALVQEHLEARGAVVHDNTGTDQALETALAAAVHKAIKKVSTDLEKFSFNTAIAAQMELVNELYQLKTKLPLGSEIWQQHLQLVVAMLAPFAPHITEEMWEQVGGETSVHVAGWPSYDPELVKEELITIVLQVNGKTRGQIEINSNTADDGVKRLAAEQQNVARHIKDTQVIKTIYVPGKLVNFVIKP